MFALLFSGVFFMLIKIQTAAFKGHHLGHFRAIPLFLLLEKLVFVLLFFSPPLMGGVLLLRVSPPFLQLQLLIAKKIKVEGKLFERRNKHSYFVLIKNWDNFNTYFFSVHQLLAFFYIDYFEEGRASKKIEGFGHRRSNPHVLDVTFLKEKAGDWTLVFVEMETQSILKVN